MVEVYAVSCRCEPLHRLLGSGPFSLQDEQWLALGTNLGLFVLGKGRGTRVKERSHSCEAAHVFGEVQGALSV